MGGPKGNTHAKKEFNNHWIVGGIVYILLTQNQVAIINEFNLWKVKDYRWYASWCNSTKSFYAITKIKKETTGMHRLVMNTPEGKVVDHKNSDTLDNRIENLWNCTNQENAKNQRRQENTINKYRNVYEDYRTGKHQVVININGKRKCFGAFKTKIGAALVADRIMRELNYNPNCLNFPEGYKNMN